MAQRKPRIGEIWKTTCTCGEEKFYFIQEESWSKTINESQYWNTLSMNEGKEIMFAYPKHGVKRVYGGNHNVNCIMTYTKHS